MIQPCDSWVGPKVVMLEKRRMLMDAETDRCNRVASDFLILAEKELSAFIRAVDQLFGAEQARQSALDWIEGLGRMDWPSGESIPDWRRATVGASARLGALLSDSKHRDTLKLRPVCSSGPAGETVRKLDSDRFHSKHKHVSEEIRYMSSIVSTSIDAAARNALTSGR